MFLLFVYCRCRVAVCLRDKTALFLIRSNETGDRRTDLDWRKGEFTGVVGYRIVASFKMQCCVFYICWDSSEL